MSLVSATFLGARRDEKRGVGVRVCMCMCACLCVMWMCTVCLYLCMCVGACVIEICLIKCMSYFLLQKDIQIFGYCLLED